MPLRNNPLNGILKRCKTPPSAASEKAQRDFALKRITEEDLSLSESVKFLFSSAVCFPSLFLKHLHNRFAFVRHVSSEHSRRIKYGNNIAVFVDSNHSAFGFLFN